MANKTREKHRGATYKNIQIMLRPSSLMTFEVEGQVIGARETALAMNALERFGSRVFAVMAGEFI